MRYLQLTFIPVLLTTLALFAEDDGLDEALQALKDKAPRHTYSSHAELDERVMNVPEQLTAEDRALDAKLREQEKRNEQKSARPPSRNT